MRQRIFEAAQPLNGKISWGVLSLVLASDPVFAIAAREPCLKICDPVRRKKRAS